MSTLTTEELMRALTYAKFKLTAHDQRELLADYLPYCTTVRMPAKLPRTPPKLVGTDIAHAIPLTLIAGLGNLSLGNVNPGLLGALLLGSIPGVILG